MQVTLVQSRTQYYKKKNRKKESQGAGSGSRGVKINNILKSCIHTQSLKRICSPYLGRPHEFGLKSPLLTIIVTRYLTETDKIQSWRKKLSFKISRNTHKYTHAHTFFFKGNRQDRIKEC